MTFLALLTRTACISDPLLISLLVAANILIFIAYVSISGTIIWIVARASKIPFPAIWWLFASFILSCGGTHFCSALVFFRPAFHLEAAICLFTSIISSVTAILIYRWRHLLLIALHDSTQLQDQVDKITKEIEAPQ